MAETLIEERAQHRRALLRKAILYIPAGVLATVLFAIALENVIAGNLGAIFATVLLAFIAFAVDFEGVGALRDLRGQPVATEGPILRKWTKGRLAFFGRVHYVLLERQVFEVNGATALELQEGERIRVEHWPHTNTVIRVYRLPSSSTSGTAGARTS